MRPRAGQPAGGGVGMIGDRGFGQFAGRVDPQNLTGAIAAETVDSMAGDPGIRLAHSRGKRTYTGGALTPQRFVDDPTAHGGVNSPEALDALPLSAGNRSRALGQSPRLLPQALDGAA